MKEIAYSNMFKDRGHHCGTLLIRCMDFRFHLALEENIAKLIGQEACEFDSPGVGGGGSKSIIDTDSRKVVFGALDIAVEKHGIKRIVIADHVDCGAYGGSGVFEDEKAEEEFHVARLREASEIISQTYPNLERVLIYQGWDTIKEMAEV